MNKWRKRACKLYTLLEQAVKEARRWEKYHDGAHEDLLKIAAQRNTALRREEEYHQWGNDLVKEKRELADQREALLSYQRRVREARREDIDFNATDTVEVSREWLDRVIRAVEAEAGKEKP